MLPWPIFLCTVPDGDICVHGYISAFFTCNDFVEKEEKHQYFLVEKISEAL